MNWLSIDVSRKMLEIEFIVFDGTDLLSILTYLYRKIISLADILTFIRGICTCLTFQPTAVEEKCCLFYQRRMKVDKES